MQAQPLTDTASPGKPESFTISQVARLTGINAKAIRYYESIGLLPPPERRPNQYRRYSMADVNRLILLRQDLEHYQQKLASCHPDEQEPFCTSVDLSCIAVGDEAICSGRFS